jgi:hypothetical protein
MQWCNKVFASSLPEGASGRLGKSSDVFRFILYVFVLWGAALPQAKETPATAETIRACGGFQKGQKAFA